MAKRNHRVLLGLREIAGYYSNLKRGFDEIGVPCAFLNLMYHPHRYREETNPTWVRCFNTCGQKLSYIFHRGWLKRLFWFGFLQNFLTVFALLAAVWRYDVFILSSASTFFFYLELPLLKLFKKKVIYLFHGSDSRPVYLNGYVMTSTTWFRTLQAIILVRCQQFVIRIIERFADYVINIPPQAHFHTRQIISGYIIGIPITLPRGSELAYPISTGRRVNVLHAPSKPGPKGSEEIRTMIGELRAAGHQMDYVEISGRPHDEVLRALAECDFVIDELYSDTPMASFATEAASYSKPAVVGSYYAPDIHRVLPAEAMPPSLFCHPDQFKQAIAKLVVDADFRRNLGKAANNFIRDRWSAAHVAERLLQVIEDKVPTDWTFDPARLDYVFGCGLSVESARKNIASVIRLGGRRALGVKDKPELEEKLFHFSRSTGA